MRTLSWSLLLTPARKLAPNWSPGRGPAEPRSKLIFLRCRSQSLMSIIHTICYLPFFITVITSRFGQDIFIQLTCFGRVLNFPSLRGGSLVPRLCTSTELPWLPIARGSRAPTGSVPCRMPPQRQDCPAGQGGSSQTPHGQEGGHRAGSRRRATLPR